MYSMYDSLQYAKPYLLETLVSESAMKRVAYAARLLRPGLCQLECGLSANNSRVDVGVCFVRPDHRQGEIDPLAGLTLTHPSWERFRSFFDIWQQPASFLYETVHSVWIGFDLDDTNAEIHAPLFFFCLSRNAPEKLEITTTIFKMLQGFSLPDAFMPELKQSIELLPDGAYLFSGGAMFSRTLTSRLYFADFPEDAVLPYLEHIGWPGSLSELRTSLDQFLGFDVKPSVLVVDIGETVFPRIGFEFRLHDQCNRKEKLARWKPFLDNLVVRDFCTPQKRDALLFWLDSHHTHASPLQISEFPALDAALIGATQRNIDHIKVVYRPGHPLEVKGYLEFAHYWLNFDEQQSKYLLKLLPC